MDTEAKWTLKRNDTSLQCMTLRYILIINRCRIVRNFMENICSQAGKAESVFYSVDNFSHTAKFQCQLAQIAGSMQNTLLQHSNKGLAG